MSKLNVLVCGSTGYIGIELVKILARHKKINIKYRLNNPYKKEIKIKFKK